MDHLDLPYQFGILIMSTFCWNEIFLTKANWIYAIWINVSLVFYESPLNIVLMILSLVGPWYPGTRLLDGWSNESKLQSQIMKFSFNLIVPKLIMALIVLNRQGRQTSQCHRAMARQKNNQRRLKTMLWKFASKLWISFQKASWPQSGTGWF